MKDFLKRSIAYVVGSNSVNSSITIYDYQINRNFPFSGSDLIYDKTKKNYITCNKSDNNFKLYCYETSKYIDLSIEGSNFKGLDYETGLEFSGTMLDNEISIYDNEFDEWFKYSFK